MNKKSAIVLSGVLLAMILLPVIVLSSQSKKVILSKAEETNGNLLAQNNDPIQPPYTGIEKEIDQLIDLLQQAHGANSILTSLLTANHYMTGLVSDVNRENPIKSVPDIKEKMEEINKLLEELRRDSIQQAIQKTILLYNNLQETQPKSILVRREKILLLVVAKEQFRAITTLLSAMTSQFDILVLKKLTRINIANPDREWEKAIDSGQNVLRTVEEASNDITNRLFPIMDTYSAKLESIPARPLSELEGDLNGDNTVNIFDLVRVARNFGKKL